MPDDLIISDVDLYYRFHGVPVLYKSLYSKKFLQDIMYKIKRAKPANAWIYFNNTWGTAAIKNAHYLQSYLNIYPGEMKKDEF